MDSQAQLAAEAAAKGLTLTPLSHVAALPLSQKVSCCGGVVERVVAESAEDCTVLLRDATGVVHAAVHGALSARYPDAVSVGALLLLCDVTLLATGALMPPLLIVCMEHLAALLMPAAQEGETQPRSDDTEKGAVMPFVHIESQRPGFAGSVGPSVCRSNNDKNEGDGDDDDDVLELADDL